MNKKSQSMIPGASLASTIKVLAGLGPLGEKVLKQNGISEIDPKKNYSSSIRLKIFEEVRSRFGTDALYTIGIEQGLLMLSMVLRVSLEERLVKLEKQIEILISDK